MRPLLIASCLLFCDCAGWAKATCELGLCDRGDIIAAKAAAQELQCTAENMRMEQIKSYVYEVAGCGQVAYYRCWFARHGRGECCTRVDKDELQTLWFNQYAGVETCLSRDGDWSTTDWSASSN